MADELSELERRLVERARDESRGWTNADYDLVLSAADAIGEARRAMRAAHDCLFPRTASHRSECACPNCAASGGLAAALAKMGGGG